MGIDGSKRHQTGGLREYYLPSYPIGGHGAKHDLSAWRRSARVAVDEVIARGRLVAGDAFGHAPCEGDAFWCSGLALAVEAHIEPVVMIGIVARLTLEHDRHDRQVAPRVVYWNYRLANQSEKFR